MATIITPTGEVFAVDDDELRDYVGTLAALVVQSDKDGALKYLSQLHSKLGSIDYLKLIIEEALGKTCSYLTECATPPETLSIPRTISAVAFFIRTLAPLVEIPTQK